MTRRVHILWDRQKLTREERPLTKNAPYFEMILRSGDAA